MDHCRLRFVRCCLSCCIVQALVFAFLFVPSFAVDVYEVSPDTEILENVSSPSSVYVLPDDLDISEFLEAGPDSYRVYEVFSGALAPQAVGDDFPFYGSAWAVGSVSGLSGEVQLFFPINRKDCIGVDSSGRLYNVSDESFSGVMYAGGSSYTVSFGSFAYPRYREYSGSSYHYETLYFLPDESNLVLVDSPAPVFDVVDLLPWVSLVLIGGVFLCCMRKL